MSKLDSAEFDRLLAEARGAVAEARASGPDPAGSPDLRGSGTDSAAQVYAEVGIGGRLTSLRIDPDVLSLGAEPLSARVVEAVTMAQDALAAKLRQRRAAGPDLTTLDQQIHDVQQGAVRELSMLLGSMVETVTSARHGVDTDED